LYNESKGKDSGGGLVRVFILHTGGSGLDKIVTWLAEKTGIKEVAVMKSPDGFLERVKRDRPEMVFIRIGNSEIPGLGVAQMVTAIDRNIRIVFVAEEKDYALDAYEVGAYGYLLCPIEREKFELLF